MIGIKMPIERVRMLALSQIAKCLASNETVDRFVSNCFLVSKYSYSLVH
jgi:hypothetical protein